MTMTKAAQARKEQDRQDAMEHLRKIFLADLTHARKPIVYTLVTHVSASGMTRDIVALVSYGGEVVNISWSIAQVLGWKLAPRERAVRVHGVGMDMAFHLVYVLSQALYGASEGYILTQRAL